MKNTQPHFPKDLLSPLLNNSNEGSASDNKIRITSVTGFIKAINNTVGSEFKDDTGKLCFYRGQANKDWDPEAGIFRDEDLEQVEKQTFYEVVSRESNTFSQDTTMLDKLIRAQHFGAPTRLLDVTRSPLIALYFACSGNSEEDGRIFLYQIERSKLKYSNSDRLTILANLTNLSHEEREALKSVLSTPHVKSEDYDTLIEKIINGFQSKPPIQKQAVQKTAQKAVKNLVSAIRNERFGFDMLITPRVLKTPILFQPEHSNERLIAQQGAFILFGLDKNILQNAQSPLTLSDEFIIATEAKTRILTELEILGIHRQSIYSGIDNCASYILHTIKRLEKSAEGGDREAQFKLGAKYYRRSNLEKCVAYFEKAAQQGHIEAQYRLGLIYFTGYGNIKKSRTKASKYFNKAAEQGHLKAQYKLGRMYLNGEKTEESRKKAFECFKVVADTNPSNTHALSIVGAMYLYGIGIAENSQKAFEYFKKAEKQEDTNAAYYLGRMYYEGRGIEKSLKNALEYLEKAVDQGDDSAANYLGQLYRRGDGVTQDYKKARELFQRAADAGIAAAIKGLQEMNEQGL